MISISMQLVLKVDGVKSHRNRFWASHLDGWLEMRDQPTSNYL